MSQSNPIPTSSTARWALGGVIIGFFLPVFMCACLAAATLGGLGAAGGASSTRTTSTTAPVHVSGPLTGDAVAIIDVNGQIVSGDGGDFNGIGGAALASSGAIVRAIKIAAKDPSVKVILLKVDSPGGSVIASDEIYHALKTSGKPVVAYMGAIAALVSVAIIKMIGKRQTKWVQDQLERGGLLLWARVWDDSRERAAIDIMQRNGGNDVHAHAEPA